MRGDFYLVLRKKGRPLDTIGARITDRKPTLNPGEIVVRLHIDLPDSLFQKPVLEAKITVPGGRLMPLHVDADVAENIADTLKQKLGMDLQVTIVDEAA